MVINVDASRPKAETSSNLALTLALGTIVEDDTNDSFFIPINANNLTIPDYVITDVTLTNTSDVLTTINDGFIDVVVGDSITAVAGLVASTVIAKTDNNNIQVSNAATADSTESLTFSPVNGGVVNITLAAIKVEVIQAANSEMKVRLTGFNYDGSLGGTEGNASNTSSEVNLNEFSFDLDNLLVNARIPRTN